MVDIVQFLDVSEAAAFLKVSRHTIYKWVNLNRVPHRKHGKKLVFLRSELLEWSDQRAVPIEKNLHSEETSVDKEVQKAIKRAQRSLKTRSVVKNTQFPLNHRR